MYAQKEDLTQLKDWKLNSYAKSALRSNDIYSAINYYEEYIKRKPDKLKISYRLANLYFQVHNYAAAKNLFNKVYHSESEKYLEALFYYAQILKIETDYETAISQFLLFIDKMESRKFNRKNALYIHRARVEIAGCEYAKQVSPSESVVIQHLNSSINKAHLETSPIILSDSSFVYASYNLDSVPVVDLEATQVPHSKFYSAHLKGKTWQGGFEAPEPFYNFENMNTSNGIFSPDGKRFYFTASKKNWKNEMISNIYVSHKIGGQWQKPVPMDERINSSKYTSTQPSIGSCYDPDFEVVYFVSDRPGGRGGMDIWYTVFVKANFIYKNPVNAGGYINTPGDEVTPFYDVNTSTMYFSSNGLAGLGGFDIFRSEGSLVNWTAATNMGLPYNSPHDDLYFTKQAEENTGFFTSNRNGSIALKNENCCYDIFEFVPKREKEFEELQVIDNQRLTFNGENIIAIEIEENSLTFNDKMRKYVEESIQFLEKKEDIKEPAEIVFNNIYFEFNKADLTEASKSLIDSTLLLILNEYPDIVIEISAHTDYKGSRNYNLKLSQKRAESVVNYLLLQGIAANRLVPVGYGEEKPLVKSKTSDGSDIAEARQKNRRIEFKIIKIMPAENF